jgi:ribonuclease HII
MHLFYNENDVEAGVDEVARGCLLGRVYTCAVIWGKENDDSIDHPIMKDSKKLSKQKREEMYDYIKEYALDYCISYNDEKVIDDINILNATYDSMHKSLTGLDISIDNILVDGNNFKPFTDTEGNFVPHICFEKGDTKYYSIAAASILAKVEHDKYIKELCEKYPDLDEKYDLLSNMGYGTEKHINGIKKYGISEFHRKSFGICKNYA